MLNRLIKSQGEMVSQIVVFGNLKDKNEEWKLAIMMKIDWNEVRPSLDVLLEPEIKFIKR